MSTSSLYVQTLWTWTPRVVTWGIIDTMDLKWSTSCRMFLLFCGFWDVWTGRGNGCFLCILLIALNCRACNQWPWVVCSTPFFNIISQELRYYSPSTAELCHWHKPLPVAAHSFLAHSLSFFSFVPIWREISIISGLSACLKAYNINKNSELRLWK